jgi:hypothetical protein
LLIPITTAGPEGNPFYGNYWLALREIHFMAIIAKDYEIKFYNVNQTQPSHLKALVPVQLP